SLMHLQYYDKLTPPQHTFFFLYYCVAHPHLHSFPTRRSSDLLRQEAGQDALRPTVSISYQYRDSKAGRLEAEKNPWYSEQSLLRSEEHTSELQSPDHLVCRLLLEKKKKK